MERAMALHGGGVLSRISDEVLFLIVAKLPTITLVRMRAVCKGWNDLLSSTFADQIIYRNVPVVCISSFLIQLPWNPRPNYPYGEYPLDAMQLWVIDPAIGGLLKAPIPNLDNVLMDVRRDYANIDCVHKSLYCIFRRGIDSGTAFSICNPGTNTSKCLPCHEIWGWNCSGMAFDPSTRHLTLLFGRRTLDSFWEELPDDEDVALDIDFDIYDSVSNAWTLVKMVLPLGTGIPFGTGIYSKGRFHWLGGLGMAEILQFNMSKRVWTKIPPPVWVYFSDLGELEDLEKLYRLKFKQMDHSLESWDGRLALRFDAQDELLCPCYSWVLTGSDGRTVLINKNIRCMWELREENNEWCQLHITLPNPVYGVAVNSSGLTLAAGEKNMVMYDGEGRVAKTISYYEFDPEAPPRNSTCDFWESMWACEWNNVWWP